MSVMRKVLDKVWLKREFGGFLPQSTFTPKLYIRIKIKIENKQLKIKNKQLEIKNKH